MACLKIAVLTYMPYHLVTVRNGSVSDAGVMPDVLDIIAKYVGFCYQLIVPESMAWGDLITQANQSNVVMTGLMGVTHERTFLVDFSEPFWLDAKCIMYKRPVLGSDITGFVKPFTSVMWILILISTLITFMATWLIHFGRGFEESTGGDRQRRGKDDLVDSCEKSSLWTLSTLLGQSSPWMPSRSSVRVVAGLWLLATLIVGTVYRSNLKAMLILPKVALPFDTLEEFVATNIKLFTTKTGLMDKSIMEAPETSLLGKLKNRNVAHNDQLAGLQDVNKGLMAGTGSKITGWSFLHNQFSQTGKCNLYMMSEMMFQTTSQAVAFPKGSPLKPKVDRVIRGLKEFGILDHLLLTRLRNASECLKTNPNHSNELRPLELGDFYGLFCIYLGGIAIASMSFFMEMIVGPKKNSR